MVVFRFGGKFEIPVGDPTTAEEFQSHNLKLSSQSVGEPMIKIFYKMWNEKSTT